MDDIAEDLLFVNLDVGTLAVIVLVVVTTCSLATLFSLYCWHRSTSHTQMHCARCHQVVAVHGVPLPPQVPPAVPPYSIVHSVPHTAYQFQAPPPTHTSLSAKPPQHYQSQNLPAIVVNQPDNVRGGDSATFQRLGMKRPDSSINNDARTLETRALSSVQASPPEVTTPGLEPLTPSPVLSGNQGEGMRGRRVQVAGGPGAQHGVSYEKTGQQPSKLQQVRMVNFPSFQTPCTKTPSNAVKPKRSSLRGSYQGQRSVSTLQPSKLYLSGHDKQSDQPLLDVSEMCRTAITTGDLNDLCEDTAEAETSLTIFPQAILTPATISPCATLTPSPGTTLTPGATSLTSSLTPSNQYQQTEQPEQFVTDRRTELSPHLASAECEIKVNSRKLEISPQIVIAGQDGMVMDRRNESSPHLAITGHERNVTDRRSLAGGGTAPLPITTSDMFVTVRKEQHNTSPGNVFLFNKNFDPAEPHQETIHSQFHHPFSDLPVTDINPSVSTGTLNNNNSTFKRRPSHPPPPSKIPINEGYLERSGGSLKRTGNIHSSVDQSGDKLATPKHPTSGLDRSEAKQTSSKPPRPGLDRSVGKVTPKPLPPGLDHCVGSGTKSSATPVLDKSVSSSGTKLKSLPPSYPDRPRHERQPSQNTGTYTKVKSPNL